MRLLLVAPPGAGKGTQARLLSERYHVEHISSGELFRREVTAGTPLGRQVQGYLDRGDLVPDDLVRDLVTAKVAEADARGGFLLDGYPRTRAQAEDAARLARERGVRLNGAVYLDVHRDELLRRLLSRSQKEARSDDDEATIRRRLQVFEEQTRPLLDYFRERDLLISVNGEQAVDQVTKDIVDQLAARDEGGRQGDGSA